MISTINRARIFGAVLLVAAFGAGVAVGHYYLPLRAPDGVMITVKGSNRIPDELESLQLDDSQRVVIRGFLRDGTMRIGRIVRDFTVPIDAAIDSTDRQIRSVLSAEQNRRLDDIRRNHPLKRMEEKRVIDTIR
jgi:hypothetical protein